MSKIRLVLIAHRVHSRVMVQAYQWFHGWMWLCPIVITTRKRLDNWTFNAVDHAVSETARVFRGQTLP